MSGLNVIAARPEHAAEVVAVIHRSFGARPVLDPPATAMEETTESVEASLHTDGGLIAFRENTIVGAMLFSHERTGLLGLRRVSVDPNAQYHGVASAMAGVAEDVASEAGSHGLWLYVRYELPHTVRFWARRGYYEIGRSEPLIEFGKELGMQRQSDSAAGTRHLAHRLADILRPGDLLILTGDLGAGKTTFTQGLGEALGVRGAVTSPTFIIARAHPSARDGPSLVHVDAYRLGSAAELDDLDLDASIDEAVTVVEWGADMAEQLADSYLEIRFERLGDDLPPSAESRGEESRRLTFSPYGRRWFGTGLCTVFSSAPA